MTKFSIRMSAALAVSLFVLCGCNRPSNEYASLALNEDNAFVEEAIGEDQEGLIDAEAIAAIDAMISSDGQEVVQDTLCWRDRHGKLVCTGAYPRLSGSILTTNTRDLPKTRERGRGSPPCGSPNAYTGADVVVYALGKAIDKALESYTGGVPIASTFFSEPSVKDWIKSRLGVNRGKSSCASVCIAYRSGTLTEFGVRTRTIGKGGWSEARNHGPAQYSNVPYAALDGITKSVRGRKTVMCANVRHWDHDDRKRFQFMIRTRR